MKEPVTYSNVLRRFHLRNATLTSKISYVTDEHGQSTGIIRQKKLLLA